MKPYAQCSAAHASHRQFGRFLCFEVSRLWLWLTFLRLLAAAVPGDVDPTFDPGSTVDSTVFSFAVQPDGKIIIGGNFQTVHGVCQAGVARLGEDGDTDTTFAVNLTGGAATAYTVMLQPDGKIVVGGGFTNINGLPRTNLVRLEADGSLDPSFTVQLTGNYGAEVRQMVRQSDGKILIAGSFSAVNGVSRPGLARLHVDGSLDAGFLNGLSGPGISTVNAMVVLPDGRILIAGYFETFNGVDRPNLARLQPDGTLDTTFLNALTGPDMPVRAVERQSDGKIVIGGVFSAVNGVAQPGIARLHVDGELDVSFQSAAIQMYGGANKIVITPEQKILLGGCLAWLGERDTFALVRLNPDGSRDASFNCDISAADDVGAREVGVLGDGRILVTGGHRSNGLPAYFCRRFADGSHDETFQNGPAGANNDVRELLLQPDGKLIIGGRFSSFNGTNSGRITRLNSNGSQDVDFASHQRGTDGEVFALGLTSAGKCLVGGTFSTINGLARPALARLNLDGSVDDTFLNVFSGQSVDVFALAVQSDDKILVGGSFKSVNGVALTNLVRLHADGSVDTSFQPRIGGGSFTSVSSLRIQNDGKILMGGYFNSIGGVTRNSLARLQTDGSLDTSFLNGMTGLNSTPNSIALQSDGKVLVGGWFSTVNGVTRHGFARLNPDGSVDHLFQTSLQDYCSVWAIAPQPDGKIVVGGYFHVGSAIRHLVRFNPDGQVDPAFGSLGYQLNEEVHALVLQPDTKIILSGMFTIVGQYPRIRLARVMGDLESPAITAQPQSQTVELGQPACIRVQAHGSKPLTYLWYFNGSDCLGATTNNTWTLPEARFDQLGSYSVIITNAGGAVTSAPAILSVIPAVERRLVPGIRLMAQSGDLLNVEHQAALDPAGAWIPLTTVTMQDSVQWCFDLNPIPTQRFYRAWTTGNSDAPGLGLGFIPALTLTGNIGDSVRVDGLNAVGPIDAWFPLATVSMTNTSQFYFDLDALGKPSRLYRFVTLP